MESKPEYIIDVRNQEEYSKGHLKGAVLIPYTEIEQKINSAVTDKNSVIVLYCRSGRRAGIAKETMERIGYKNVSNLGGMEEASGKLNVPIVR